MPLSYAGKAYALLERYNVEDYDLVKIITEKGEIVGRIMPRPSIFDDEHVIIKLPNGYNIGVNIGKISEIKVLEKAYQREEAIPEVEFRENLPYIPLIVTGGTISSRVDYRTGAVRAYEKPEELLDLIPELADIANIKYKPIFAEFSENLTPSHWKKMAERASEELNSGARGVVIAHGTDTMHYSAAALSFMLMNLRKPVVFVGSQRSIDRPSTDAVLNLIAAVKVAAQSDIGEVVITMHGSPSDEFAWVLRGVKARKMHTSRRDAFIPVNSPPIAKVTREKIEIMSKYRKADESSRVEFDGRIDERVFLLYTWPGMSPDIIESIRSLGYRGLVIAGTGLGHTPSRIIPSIERLVRDGVPVVMTSQTIFGRVNLRVYETGRLLLKAGVIPGEDMLPEVALVKLMFVLGHCNEMECIREMMLRNIAGEISSSISMRDFPPCWVMR
ncbi:MAG: Glu-tRNA(Gln) amidotransferase GatDE subunit D [Thermoproteota archaeon]|jgi:glutamyl-tRNA(Gln) amidotransferase subunit D|uniref:Glutamyl-tRNA(Gln) amidotransferase subunit D n=1 Tax=Candidatus Methanodesulfokora washburnensis TaxID=2478471 RepID=A0A520KMB9_9CREN|nr:MAG: Glu-tRNA(Gln) amidotransferase subunit GatD [Candidatus Methanodesulfokores washburnensis]TDA38269.1 MAG: Glu-tRNA(Gln) amidotransferase GatDE subunit D [Candidatus Korarchaeota archaeon]